MLSAGNLHAGAVTVVDAGDSELRGVRPDCVAKVSYKLQVRAAVLRAAKFDIKPLPCAISSPALGLCHPSMHCVHAPMTWVGRN